MSILAIIAVDRFLALVDDALEAYVDKKVRQPRLEAWAQANPDVRVIYPSKPRVHMSVDEARLAHRGHINTKKEGEERFQELAPQFPKAWGQPKQQ